ncbi:MAG TPA: hypothetical protein VMW24_09510 [Sedimentisphaerales bacterium]|nr:hypothetical protein [Sedimentisphaerales bacterium]
MNRRLIKKILKKKHDEFCASIRDENVRALVKKNALITGGSIVSLLLKEPIKDFDYYFRNKETVEAVARYYAQWFIALNPEGLSPTVEVSGERVRIVIPSAGVASDESDETERERVEAMEGSLDMGTTQEDAGTDAIAYRPVFLSENAITLSNKVQLVVRFHGEPEDIHKNYDFVHCTNYWTAWDDTLVLRPAALESILARELFYVGSLYPLCSVIRTRKFLKRGWHINAGQYLKMCFQISELDLSDIGVLQEQLTGVDAAYFMQIIDYCKKRQETEPDFNVTMPYLCKIVDRIFGGPDDA